MGFLISADEPTLVSRNVAGNALNSALRKFVGRGKPYSVKTLSNATRIKDRVIECAMCHPEDPEYRPLKPEALLSIMAVLGDAFTTEFLKPACQGAFDLPDCEIPHPAHLTAEDAQDHAELAVAVADGLDYRDAPVLRRVGLREIRRGQKLLALGARA